MFTDIADSTTLKSRLGLNVYSSLASAHDSLMREMVGAVAGAEILKDTGDGFMILFPTSSAAVSVALRFQHAIGHLDHPDASSTEEDPRSRFLVRIGIHMGEVADLGPDIYGKQKVVGLAADLSARIESLAKPGQILLTRGAFDDARQFIRSDPSAGAGDSSQLRWMAHGPYLFKGAEEPLEVYEVGVVGEAPLAAPPDSEKVRRVIPPGTEAMYDWRPAAGLSIPGRDRWRLERQIGEGGFGEVWLAQHEQTGLPRVFKFCFNADRLRGLRRELTLFRVLRETLGQRADIAQLYEVSLDQPPFSIEYEYSPEGDLRAWADARGGIATVPLSTRLDLLARTAQAVAAAHSAGVLHKDLKPTNILITVDDQGTPHPKIIDFGIGVLTDPAVIGQHHIANSGFTETQLTENESSRTGTRLYAPPESLSADPKQRRFTPQGDVYSLGVLLYQLAIGDLDRPLAYGWEREVDAPLAAVIARCIDGDVTRRYPTADELAHDLSALAETYVGRDMSVLLPRIEPGPQPVSLHERDNAAVPTSRQHASRPRAILQQVQRHWLAAFVALVIVCGLIAVLASVLPNHDGNVIDVMSEPHAFTVSLEPALHDPQGQPVRPGELIVDLRGSDLHISIADVTSESDLAGPSKPVPIPDSVGILNFRVSIESAAASSMDYSSSLPTRELLRAFKSESPVGDSAINPDFKVTGDGAIELFVPVLKSLDLGFSGVVRIVLKGAAIDHI